MPSTAQPADIVAGAIRAGGVVAYPTEAVWGLGCDPLDEAATRRLLALKQRSADKGLILVAGCIRQLDAYIDWDALPQPARERVLAGWPGPHTWIMPASAAVPDWIRGHNPGGVAVRTSAHPPVISLCRAWGGALVSTSANTAGVPPPRTLGALEPAILAGVDAVLQGNTGGLASPTPIRDALTGARLR